MANINIPIPDPLHKRLKLMAVEQEKTLKELIIELLGRRRRR